MMKLDILAFGAHPDDVELGCAGTLAKEIANGKKVGIVDLTQGELGTRGSAELRMVEAANAAKVMGVSARENLKMADGFFVNDKEHQLEVIKMLRKYKPEMVICNAVRDRHIDHGKGSNLVSDACFLSGLRKIETVLNGEKQEAWRPKVVYHYLQWRDDKPDFIVDITGYMDTKIEAIKAYKSQFYDPNSDEPETPITSKTFFDSLTYRAEDLGRIANVKYAEGFTTERYITVDKISDLI
ncbi:bacillithiol biosynthesis deacetylase BshB1 [Neptunitalea sp. Y10]|uniref:Bacillithiol biosynthesis deacetylase BshB1 n=2 Tax=Neptunitalea lumnitzerae TaxID=2965509 RepID=A0ABQ5MJN2_9FLAO|nr:bacillithiol biosynthesis deacetylase BshB1 [Neptunitalea sp. Y10]